MGPSHGGMHRSLEMMKQMARTGGAPDRDPVENWLPAIALGILVLGGAIFAFTRIFG